MRGSAAAPGGEGLEGGFVAGSHDLDMAFRGVADPAGDRETVGFFFSRDTIRDSLDAAFDEQVQRWHH